MMAIKIATKASLEYTAQALAEGEHDLGSDATAAGYALVMWVVNDCPWFNAGPSHYGNLVSEFVGFDVERF